jgi:SAM-dependent methyltransferase
MNRGIPVFEYATSENFNARGYLLANRDLRAAFGDDEVAAARHLLEYGLTEARRQLSAQFLSSRHTKFALFKGTLPDCDVDCFPVEFSTSPYLISQYADESSNEYGFWHDELEGHPDKLYADIGAGLRRTVFQNCAYVEVYPSLTADILIDPQCELPFRDRSLDGIGCFAVLEHVNKPWEMASEFARVLKLGGKLFVDWPFLQPVHGYPSHYFNATREGLRSLFVDNFEIVLYTGEHQGPDYTVNWILGALVNNIKNEAARAKLLDTSVRELLDQPPRSSQFWITILESLDDDAISMLSCGNMLVGTRK